MIKVTIKQQETYITSDEAWKLGVGKAEWQHPDSHAWYACGEECRYAEYLKYRAMQAQPEPVAQSTVLRSDFDFIMQDKQRCVKLIEEVYALLADDKSIEAKEILQKRVNCAKFMREFMETIGCKLLSKFLCPLLERSQTMGKG